MSRYIDPFSLVDHSSRASIESLRGLPTMNQKEIENRDIENCKLAALHSFPSIYHSTLFAINHILDGNYRSYQEVGDSQILQMYDMLPVKCLKDVEARLKMNNRAYFLAQIIYYPNTVPDMAFNIATEFDALRFIHNFFLCQDLLRVR